LVVYLCRFCNGISSPAQGNRKNGEKPVGEFHSESPPKKIFTIFKRPVEVCFSVNSRCKWFILNLDAEILGILKMMGSVFRNYYFRIDTCGMQVK
jgi:hypothetical protein